jgi:hypothetical protein
VSGAQKFGLSTLRQDIQTFKAQVEASLAVFDLPVTYRLARYDDMTR